MLNKTLHSRIVLMAILSVHLFAFQNCGTQFKIADQGSNLFSSDATFFSVPSVNFAVTPDFINTPIVSIGFNVAVSGSANVNNVTCQLNTGAVTDCSSGTATYNNLVDGDYVLRVVAETTAGIRTEAIKLFRKDTTAPVQTIAAMPATITNQTTANFTFTVVDNLSGVDRNECSLNNAAFAACTSPAIIQGLVAGSHNFRIRSIDRAGNISDVYNYTWAIDLNVPTVTFSQMPLAITNQTNANFAFSGTGIVTYECSLDNVAFAACVSPQALANLAAGNHTFRVRGTNAAGTVSAIAQYVWMVDNVLPTAPVIAANVLAVTQATAATFNFSSLDSGSGVASYSCSLDGVAFAACTAPVVLTNLAVGSHTFRVRAHDNAGNISTAGVFSWTIDNSGPIITLTQAPPTQTANPSANFVFSVSDATSTVVSVMCSLDNATFANCTSPYARANLNLGAHNLRIMASDTAGNATLIQHNWSVIATFSPTFTTVPQGLSSYTARAGFGQRVYFEGQNIYAPTDGGLSISRNGGSTFSTRTTVNGLNSNQVSHVAVSGNNVYAATYGWGAQTYSGIAASRDGGNTFTNTTLVSSTNSLLSYTVMGLQAVGNTVYASIDRPGLAISTDAGATYTYREVAPAGTTMGELYVVGSTLYIATSAGLAVSTDGGNTFTFRTTANGLPSNDIVDLAVTNNAIYVLVQSNNDNRLYRSVDNGNTFTLLNVDPAIFGRLYNVGAAGNNLILTTVAGIAVSNNSGDSFVLRSVNLGYRSGKPYVAGNTAYIQLSTGEMIGTTDAGTTFSFIGERHIFEYGSNFQVSLASSGNRLYLGGNLGLYVSTDGGSTFSPTGLNSTFLTSYTKVFTDGANVYVGDVGNFLFVSRDNGVTFTRRTDANGLTNAITNGGYASGNNVYVATDGGLAISTDAGNTFIMRTTANGLANNRVLHVTAQGNTIYASTESGLSISTDGGGSFVTRNATHGLGESSFFVATRQTQIVNGSLYVLTATQLYKSTNGGTTFSRLPASPSGLQAFFVDSNGDIIAAGDDGLYISSDDGGYFIRRTYEHGLGSNRTQCLHKFDGKIFACGFNGLYRSN